MVLDIILIAILVYSGVQGYRKGLLRTGLTFFKGIISIIIAKIFNDDFIVILDKYTNLRESTRDTVNKVLLDLDQVKNLGIQSIGESQMKNIMSEWHFPDFIQDEVLSKFLSDLVNKATVSVTDFVSEISLIISDQMFEFLAFVVFFWIVSIAVEVLIKMLRVVDRLPIIGLVNGVSGFVVGVLSSAIIIYLICWVGNIMLKTGFYVYVQQSKVLKFFVETNPLNIF